MTRTQGIGEEGNRKRRAHKKSRLGCRNCKLRRVKVSHAGMPFFLCRITDVLLECDETRPNCKKCTSFGVSCNYDSKAPDLQTSFDGTATIKSLQKPPRSINQALLGMTKVPAPLHPALILDNNSTFQVDGQCLDRLGRFHMRTVLSIGTSRAARLFQSVAIKLACSVRTHIEQSDIHANIAFLLLSIHT
jgi:hypothetical protein